MHAAFSIDALPAARRAPAWRDAVCSTFVRLDCQPDAHAPLHGQLESAQFGDLHVARVLSSPQQVHRTPALAAVGDEAYVLMSLQLRGRTRVQQGPREALLTPGCLAFYDTTRPYTLQLPDHFEQLVLHLPHASLEAAAPGALDRMALALPATDPFAQALSAVAPQLLRLAATQRPELAARCAATARELIALALESLHGGALATPPAHHETVPSRSAADALVWRARDVIGHRLGEPALDASTVAQAVGVSLRRLQEAFQQHHGTISDCIWEMRLEFSRCLLASSTRLSVADVAQRAGFLEAAHFSRRFRQRYGLAPRGYRDAARTGPQP